MNLKFILGVGSIISNYRNKEKISPINSKYIKLITNSLYSNNIPEAIILVSDLKNHLISNLCDISVVKFYIKEMMYVVFQYLCESQNISKEILEDYYQNFTEFDIRFTNIEQAINYICEKLKVIDELPDTRTSLLVIKALKFVKNEYEKNLTLHDIADRLNVSVSYLSRIFKEATGKNFKEYLIEVKIKQSKEKLINKNLSINDIAESVGYSDPGQFSRIFKKYEGQTPAQYRLNHHVDHLG
jgi:two-component system response regulator YesN